MATKTTKSKKAKEKEILKKIFSNYADDSESLLPILQDIQEELHYLPEEYLKETAHQLKVSLNRVFSVATFYNAFSLIPKGKYNIQVCAGTACHIKGANRLLDEITSILGIKEGETTDDGLFSVETVRCLGCCSLAPVMNINGKTYGNLKPENIREILETYKS